MEVYITMVMSILMMIWQGKSDLLTVSRFVGNLVADDIYERRWSL
jgi:hypothetical protein